MNPPVRAALLVSLVMVASGWGADRAPAPISVTMPAPRPRLTEELRRQVEETSAAKNPAGAVVTSDGTVMLPAMRVEGSRGPYREKIVPVIRQKPFTLVNGGTFLKYEGRKFTLETGIKFDPHGGFDLLSIRW